MEETQNNQPSGAERTALKKQYQEARRQNAGKFNSLRIGIWIIVIVLAGLGVWWYATNSSDSPVSVEGLEVRENDNVAGPATASVTMIEYGDFQCPACAHYANFTGQLKLDFPQDLRFVFRHFPLTNIHLNAFPAAQAAEAAARQGKFWEMHDILFFRQNDWAQEADAKSIFRQYADELGLDLEQYDRNIADDEIEQKVRDNFQEGVRLGVDATPTFFVNGERLRLQDFSTYEDLKTYIQSLIDQDAGTDTADTE